MLQDSDGPRTLYDLCLAQVSRSLEDLCSKRADGSLILVSASVFPQEVADQLLHTMTTQGLSGAVERVQRQSVPATGGGATAGSQRREMTGCSVGSLTPADVLHVSSSFDATVPVKGTTGSTARGC